MPTTLALVICLILLILWKIDFVASLLNLKALKPELPKEFEGVYDKKKYEKSQLYTAEGERFSIIDSIVPLTVLLGFWFTGGFGWLDNTVRSFGWGPTWTGVAFVGALLLAQYIMALPFSIYSTFVIEEKFGFNKTTPKTFVSDQIKALILGALIGLPILALVIWIFNSVNMAWLWAWIAFTAIQLLLTYLAPTYLMPLFNKFTPMEDGELKSDIEAMAKKCDFPLTELYIMDGSKRSSKSNAFFTGFGNNKKIALFDTLIKDQTNEELVAVLAHEIGHFKCKHIIKRLLTGIFSTAAIFFLLGFATDASGPLAQPLHDAFMVNEVSVHAGLVFFLILFTPVSRVLGVLGNISSRKHEFEADAYAAEVQGTPDHLISALKKLSSGNLANLTPHPFPVFLNYSHPPMLERIDALKGLKKT